VERRLFGGAENVLVGNQFVGLSKAHDVNARYRQAARIDVAAEQKRCCAASQRAGTRVAAGGAGGKVATSATRKKKNVRIASPRHDVTIDGFRIARAAKNARRQRAA